MSITLAPTTTQMRRSGRFAAAWRVVVLALLVAGATLVLPVRSAAADVTFNQKMMELLNRDRAAAGLPALAFDPSLAAVAEDQPYNGCGFTVLGRAKDMGTRNYFSHQILGCALQGVTSILTGVGISFSGSGENIAWMSGATDPVVAASNLQSQFMSSTGHRNNILNPQFTRVGIGSWRTAAGQTWSGGGYALTNVFIAVQIFAGGAVTTTTTTVAPTTTSTTVPPAPAPGAGYHPVTPSRILDTRIGNGAPTAPLGAGATLNLQVAGRGGVPATGVSAVVMNVAVTQPTAASFLTVYPAGENMPGASNLNYVAGQTVPNLVTAKVGSNGQVSIFNLAGSTHVIADVAGWFDTGNAGGAGYHPVSPSRILDTRIGHGAATGPLNSGSILNLQVAGRGGVPSTGVSAVIVNVAVTQPSTASHLIAFPAGEPVPATANLNFTAGQTVPNLVVAKLGANGQLSFVNALGSTHIVADVAGWYDIGTTPAAADFHALTPSRILDTRTGNGAPVGALGAGTMNLQITGRGGVPATGVSAVVLSVAVTEPTTASNLIVWPTGEAAPVASNLNYVGGQTVPNLVVAKVGANGQITLFNSFGSTHVVADVAGWYDVG
jgi:uncharacterized protein YkwD